jgi:hypothetical protein
MKKQSNPQLALALIVLVGFVLLLVNSVSFLPSDLALPGLRSGL